MRGSSLQQNLLYPNWHVSGIHIMNERVRMLRYLLFFKISFSCVWIVEMFLLGCVMKVFLGLNCYYSTHGLIKKSCIKINLGWILGELLLKRKFCSPPAPLKINKIVIFLILKGTNTLSHSHTSTQHTILSTLVFPDLTSPKVPCRSIHELV